MKDMLRYPNERNDPAAIFMERSYFREMLLTHEQTTWDAVLVKSYTIFSQLTSSGGCQNQYIIVAATVVSNNMLLWTSWPCVYVQAVLGWD